MFTFLIPKPTTELRLGHGLAFERSLGLEDLKVQAPPDTCHGHHRRQH